MCLQIGGNYIVKLIEEYKRDRTMEDERVIKIMVDELCFFGSVKYNRKLYYTSGGGISPFEMRSTYTLAFSCVHYGDVYNVVVKCVVLPRGDIYGEIATGAYRRPFKLYKVDVDPVASAHRVFDLLQCVLDH